MTNKKFKLAAMSLALTACVAASPLAANAESAGTEATSSTPAVETPAPTAETSGENAPTTNETKQNPTDESKQESTNESKQESTDESKQESTDESKQESTDESKQESTNESKQESTNESKQESTDESKQESTDETKQESTNESKQNPTDEIKQNPTDEIKQNPTDETKQNPTDETKQNPTDEIKQNPTDETKQEAAVENNDLAVAPAPVLMLAKAPAAPTATPTTPAEDNTVATITRQDGTTTTTTKYTSFDEAVSKANDGDTIEVIKDATSTGIDLQNKNLTIKGKTVTTTTDSGTEEKTTVKPKLQFVAKDGQPKIFGITLRGSNLTFQNMDVDMTGASSTTDNKWNAVCMSGDAALTLKSTDLFMNGKGLDERKDQEILKPHGIYMAGRGRNELNVDDHSTLTINNYYNAIAWDGVGNEDSIYYINIKNGSTFTADGNEAGIVGLESLDVLVEDSTMTITNCRARYPDKTDNRVSSNEHEGRSGLNGADVTITRSNVTISGCEQGYGIHTRDLHVENSTLTTDNNGYSSIFITGKGEFINSTINARGNTGLGNDTIEITRYTNETGIGYHYGSLKVTNSTLNITNNNATGIRCNFGDLNIDDASRVTVQYNKATDNNGYNSLLYGLGGGLVVRRGTTAKLGANTTINNNSAALAGADIFIEKGGKLTFSVGNAGIGDILNKGQEDADCGHKIDGWYIDANGSRWNFDADADAAQAFLDSLDELPEGVTVNYDPSTGLYTITVAKTVKDGFALKAAHAELPAPTPDPDGPDTPTPNPNPKPEPKPGPDTSITPEDPQLHPVQDARADTPDSPVLPSSPANPAVQDAHALPQTGTSLFAALAMALSGFALTIAGAWASLLGKNSRH